MALTKNDEEPGNVGEVCTDAFQQGILLYFGHDLARILAQCGAEMGCCYRTDAGLISSLRFQSLLALLDIWLCGIDTQRTCPIEQPLHRIDQDGGFSPHHSDPMKRL